MADVTGQISGSSGVQDVTLNNAATEATLKALLSQARTDSAVLKAMATKAGVDAKVLKDLEKTSKNASDNLEEVADTAERATVVVDKFQKELNLARTAFNGLDASLTKLMAGASNTSEYLGAFSQMPGIVGMVASAFQRLASFQENNMKGYQQISNAGVTFSGSLTDMRLAAAKSYLTMDQFAKLMSTNGDAFSRMGGTANEGALAFSKVSNDLLKSGAGDNLRALGYTSEQVNQGLANYISMTGGRNKQEMQNSAALTQAASDYMTQLDGLAEITGKSREQQEQEMKEASANQAYQAYLLTLDEEGKKKANAALAEANAKGGKGAMQALQSQLLGLPPMTKAAQQFTALAPGAAAATKKMAADVGDSTKQVSDIQKDGARMGVAVSNDVARLGKNTTSALIMQGGALSGVVGQMQGTANQLQQQGVKSNADAEAQLAKVKKDQDDRSKSEAAQLVASQKVLQDFTIGLMNAVAPMVKFLTPALEYIGPAMIVLGGAITAYKSFLVWQMLMGKKDMAEKAGGGLAQKALGAAEGGAKGGGLGELLKGVGSGVGAVLKGLAQGLTAFANPMILVGAAIFGASVGIIITLVGAGIAAAAYIIGKSLPTLSEGLSSFAKIDGSNLIQVAKGIGALGIALVAFAAGSTAGAFGSAISSMIGGITKLFGGNDVIGQVSEAVKKLTPILPSLTALGPALSGYAKGLNDVGSAIKAMDVGKAVQVADALSKMAAAKGISNVLGSISGAITNSFGGGGATPTTAAAASAQGSIDKMSNDWAWSVYSGKATMAQVPRDAMSKVQDILKNPPSNWKEELSKTQVNTMASAVKQAADAGKSKESGGNKTVIASDDGKGNKAQDQGTDPVSILNKSLSKLIMQNQAIVDNTDKTASLIASNGNLFRR